VQVSDAVEAVLARALSVDLRARPLRAGEFWDALRTAVLGPAISTPGSAVVASSGRALTPAPSPAMSVPPSFDPSFAGQRTELAPSAIVSRAPGASTTQPSVGPVSPSGRGPLIAAVAGVVLIGGVIVVGSVGLLALGARSRPKPPAGAVAPSQTAQPSSPEAHATGDAHRTQSRGPEGMVTVPAGKFTMGTDRGGKSEGPAHEVTLTKGFFLDSTEVTVAAYRQCVSAGKCVSSAIHDDARAAPDAEDVEKFASSCNERHPERGNHPINCVDQRQARAYCAFVGKRLPTEAEWEYAARGTDARTFPWGEEKPGCTHAAVSGCAKPTPGLAGTKPVGAFPDGKSPFGAFDMSGNVFEWVEDGWSTKPYVRSDGAVDPLVRGGPEAGVLRGGSWDFSAAQLVSTFRLKYPRTAGHVSTGFRCAKTME
jgi:formylglycine-generating enzyme required for sulfatase activity